MSLQNLNNLQFVKVSTEHRIASVASLARLIWNEHYLSNLGQKQIDYMLSTLQSTEAIQKDIESGALKYYIIRDTNRNVGYTAYRFEDDAILMSKCYLLNHVRGQGYFSTILKAYENLAYSEGVDTIRLYVNKYNSSLLVYEHKGFKNVASHQFDIGQGYIMDDYEMVKTLEKRASHGNE